MAILINKPMCIKVIGVLLFTFLLTYQPSFANDSLKPGEWFVRLIAQDPSENLEDRGNVLGVLRTSRDGYDRHDLKELPPFAAPYLTIVFPHPEWGKHAGDYASDFHQKGHWRDGERWDFVVKSDIPRQITLRWEGYDGIKRLRRMRLVDMETG